MDLKNPAKDGHRGRESSIRPPRRFFFRPIPPSFMLFLFWQMGSKRLQVAMNYLSAFPSQWGRGAGVVG